jgi:plastocyanin
MVATGTTVTWTSIDDATDHTITSGAPMAPEGKFDGRVARAGTFSHTFKEVGTFAYYCKVHPTMVGTVTVR